MDKRVITSVVLAASAAFGWFISTNYAEREAMQLPNINEAIPRVDYETPVTNGTTTNYEPIPATPLNIAPIEPDESISLEKGGCYIGGCSSQICSDNKEIVSTCEWRESYACYAQATCERQSNGVCGWIETPELSQCLAKPDSGMELSNDLNEVM